jgi:hypothetical protein
MEFTNEIKRQWNILKDAKGISAKEQGVLIFIGIITATVTQIILNTTAIWSFFVMAPCGLLAMYILIRWNHPELFSPKISIPEKGIKP